MSLGWSIIICGIIMLSLLLAGAVAMALCERFSREDESEQGDVIDRIKADVLKKQWDTGHKEEPDSGEYGGAPPVLKECE